MSNLLLVDLCNVKRWGGIHGSVRQTIKFVTKKVGSFVQSGFKAELVVDGHQSNGSSVERESVAQNIECVFTCADSGFNNFSADDYIFDVVLGNIKNKKYQKITVVTNDKGLRIRILLGIGPHSTFNLEFLGVADFLNKHHF